MGEKTMSQLYAESYDEGETVDEVPTGNLRIQLGNGKTLQQLWRCWRRSGEEFAVTYEWRDVPETYNNGSIYSSKEDATQ